MGWYRVVKTVKGHRYLYEQRSWREGKKVRTESRYIGPAGDDKTGGGSITSPAASLAGGLAGFGEAMLEQFDVERWGIDAAAQIGLGEQKKAKKPTRSKSPKPQITTPQDGFSDIKELYRGVNAGTADK